MSDRPRSRSRSPTSSSGRDKVREDRTKDHKDRKDKVKETEKQLPLGAQLISDSDYFVMNAEFRLWLKEEKDKVRFPLLAHHPCPFILTGMHSISTNFREKGRAGVSSFSVFTLDREPPLTPHSTSYFRKFVKVQRPFLSFSRAASSSSFLY